MGHQSYTSHKTLISHCPDYAMYIMPHIELSSLPCFASYRTVFFALLRGPHEQPCATTMCYRYFYWRFGNRGHKRSTFLQHALPVGPSEPARLPAHLQPVQHQEKSPGQCHSPYWSPVHLLLLPRYSSPRFSESVQNQEGFTQEFRGISHRDSMDGCSIYSGNLM